MHNFRFYQTCMGQTQLVYCVINQIMTCKKINSKTTKVKQKTKYGKVKFQHFNYVMHLILKTIIVHKYKLKFSLYQVTTCYLCYILVIMILCMLLVITKINDTI
jgi:hypothetical protein